MECRVCSGHGIGVRLIDDFLSKTQQRCTSFRETMDVIAHQAFPMFLNISGEVKDWNAEATECSIVNFASYPNPQTIDVCRIFEIIH